MRTVWLAALLAAGCNVHPVLDEDRVVDLSYAYDETTVYWPTGTPFQLEEVARGYDEAGLWYAANRFCSAEHGGTHLDAPLHFAEGRRAADELPLHQLIAPARVIDVREACAADPDYRLAPRDVLEHERLHGPIPPGSAVLVLTGWGRLWPDAERYLGSAERGTIEGLHFPGISPNAAYLLVERRVDLVGIDTASLDHGPSREFPAHRVLSEADVPGLENLANLERLPAAGATVVALPMKIGGGTGAPCRVIALLP